jgi:hypothetical protein
VSLRLHSTLTGRTEPVAADVDGVIGIYACGPTVYSRIHIGNARPFVVFSVLKRYIERRGQRARLVINVTDVNDKIYDAARAEGIPSIELAERCTRQYIEDTDLLGLGRPDAEPLPTSWSAAWRTRPAEMSTSACAGSPTMAACRAGDWMTCPTPTRATSRMIPSTSRSGRA